MTTKYIVKDWAGNLMNWGTFDYIGEASESIFLHVYEELLNEGLDLNKMDHLIDEYPELDNALDKIIDEYRGEYYIDEIEE